MAVGRLRLVVLSIRTAEHAVEQTSPTGKAASFVASQNGKLLTGHTMIPGTAQCAPFRIASKAEEIFGLYRMYLGEWWQRCRSNDV